MRPLQLTIKGIHSFREEQTIDFSELASQGLFGIFGPTGSGKSTILDAMTLALYARLSRSTKNFININETSAYISFRFSITSENTKEYLVERSFRYNKNNPSGSVRNVSGKIMELNGETPVILADRPSEVTQKCISLLGLTADDFMRTVVLPQGQFSDFLKLKNTERRSMLQRIFHLEEYGVELTSKITRAKQNQDLLISNLEGEISAYSLVSPEALKELQAKKQLLSDNLIKKEQEFDQKQQAYEQAKEVHLLMEELIPLMTQKEELLSQIPLIENLHNRLETGQKANRIYPFFQQRETASSRLASARQEHEEALDLFTKSEQELNLQQLSHETLTREYTAFTETYHDKKDTLTKAESILKRIHLLSEDQKKANQELKKFQKNLFLFQNKEKEIEDSLQVVSHKADELNKQANLLHPDPAQRQLLETGKQFEENYEKILESCHKLFVQLHRQETEKSQLETEQDHLLWKLISCYKDCSHKRASLQKELESCEGESQEIKEQIHILQEEEHNFTLEHWAQILRENLSENAPCPVCGSIHHAFSAAEQFSAKDQLSAENQTSVTDQTEQLSTKDYLSAEDQKDLTSLREDLTGLSEKISDLRQRCYSMDSVISEIKPHISSIKNVDLLPPDSSLDSSLLSKNGVDLDCKNARNYLNRYLSLAGNLEQQQQHYLSILAETKKEFENLQTNYEHLMSFQKQHGFLPSDIEISTALDNMTDFFEKAQEVKKTIYPFAAQRKAFYEQEEQYHRILKEQSDLHNKKEALLNEIQTIIKQKNEYENSFSSGQAELTRIENQLKEEYDSYPEGLSLDLDCQKELLFLENQQKEWQEKTENSNLKLKIMEKKYNDANVSLSAKKAAEINFAVQYAESSSIYDDERKKENFSPETDLTTLILSDSEQKELTRQINDFEAKQSEISERISYIEDKLQNKNANQTEEEWLLIQENYNSLSKELNDLRKESILMDHKQNQLVKSLEEKNKIQQKLDQASHRKSIIHELEQLFKGNTFIEYISQERLIYIAREASDTLFQISNGKYTLEVNEQTEFVIRDHHNGGMIRPCDTLSGGETFITSLCLALALSSTIQLNKTAPLELFFLDEGFGSLDEELLDVVMNSLEKLQNRKRSIGIISHVESIQCRVPRKLIVTPAKAEKDGSRVRLEFS